MSGSNGYRADIDGLRAIAIIPVLIFHAYPSLLPGGFIGVDVFFVISGYLISRILIEQLNAQAFSLRTFYAHRVRRIFPALILALLSTLGIGFLFATPDELTQLGSHASKSALFVQNFNLLKESGYFDGSTQFKPLLHLWSLAIEEQFYFVYPIALWLIWKFKSRIPATIVLTSLIAISFAACVWQTFQQPSEAFYLPYFRFWELLAGGLLAISANHIASSKQPFTAKNSTALIGIAGLVLGFIFIHENHAFPGWLAALPVLSTLLIIHAGPQAWLNRAVLAHPWAVWVGRISYPLYLWHWPLLAFLNITGHNSPLNNWLALCLSVGLAWATYEWVEKRIRHRTPTFTLITTLCLCLAAIAILGHQLRVQHGLPKRSFITEITGERAAPKHIKGLVDVCTAWIEPGENRLSYCLGTPDQTPKVALIGDSKAISLSPGIFENPAPATPWILLGGANQTGALIPVMTSDHKWGKNQKHIQNALSVIERNPSIEVIVIANTMRNFYQISARHTVEEMPTVAHGIEHAAEKGLNRFIDQMRAANKKIILVEDNPPLQSIGRCSKRNIDWQTLHVNVELLPHKPYCSLSYSQFKQQTARYDAMLRRVQARHPEHIYLFDLPSFLCDINNDTCPYVKGGIPMYSYTDHISNQASRLVAPALQALVNRVLTTNH